MRESNFAFPAQNKACVCITSQLYDRRALDTTSPLPLFNSLTHLTYLTSTSPRIREIMTMDGGLERLVRILHEFCMCPPPPENPAILYGLMPPNARPPKLNPALNPPTFDKHAAYRFSLAFQCIVNIGVRGSEPIRSRVVQAGTLDVVGCILEAWLANKGFAVGPSAGATNVQRETREQRHQRKLEQRQREDAIHLQRALQRQLQADQQARPRQGARTRANEEEEFMDYSPAEQSTSQILLLSDSISQPSNSASNSDTDISTDNSLAATPQESGTPTGSVIIPSRDRSGTIIGRPIWDHPLQPPTGHAASPGPANLIAMPPRGRRIRHRELPPESPGTSTDVSRPETETEDDGDIDMDRTDDHGRMIDSDVTSASASPSPERRTSNVINPARQHLARRAVGIVSDEPAAVPQNLQVGGLGLDTDAHIIINEGGGVGDGGVEVGVGVEDGIVSLEQNDDFAMGAPPGAPGAIGEAPTPRVLDLSAVATTNERRRRNTVTVDAPDVTPRAVVVNLPIMTTTGTVRVQPTQHHHGLERGHQRNATIRARPVPGSDEAGTAGGSPVEPATAPAMNLTPTNTLGGGRTMSNSHGSHHHNNNHSSRDSDSSGPYRDEDVLLSLQLLAYLSKYPHVRQTFYKPRVTFHPASVNLGGARFGMGVQPQVVGSSATSGKQKDKERAGSGSSATGVKDNLFRAFSSSMSGSSRGKEKERPQHTTASTSTAAGPSTPTSSAQTPVVLAPPAGSGNGAPSSARQTNVFSLVERFTYKPSSTETGDGINSPPRLPPEIQYWAGVIMRNACRKDDSRGGIRQCANMMCGKWETYPREFAKCRRCRKAKYCGKECQSTAWSEGHRFWCSAKDVDEDSTNNHQSTSNHHHHHHHHNNHNASDTPRGGSSTHASIQVTDEEPGQVDVPLAGSSISSSVASRRQHRERPNQNHGPSAVVQPSSLSSTNYISPTTVSGVRAETSMNRDRTIQSIQFGPGLPSLSQVRPRLLATIRPPLVQDLLHDPTSTGYLSFHIQGSAGSSPNDREAVRRRPEVIIPNASGSTISPGSAGAAGMNVPSPSPNRVSLAIDVRPNIGSPSSPTRTAATANQQLQMSYTQTITQATVGLHPRVLDDWPMSSPSPSTRRVRISERESRSRGEDVGDDMVLG